MYLVTTGNFLKWVTSSYLSLLCCLTSGQWWVVTVYYLSVGNQAIKPRVGDHCILVAHPAFYHLLSNRSMKIKKLNLKNRRYTFHSSSVGTGSSLVIKGLPGSGKTTLMWHTSQQWAKRELLQHFSLFLSIPLRSTRVQHATCLADFIPHPDQEQRKAIAQAISATSGKGVCFWFDGWDEMPQEVQRDSFIASFIRRDSPGSSLPRCTTVVTTRPEALSLEIKSSEKIWMSLNGLTGIKVNEIITKSVEGTDHDPSELIAVLKATPLFKPSAQQSPSMLTYR